MQIEDIFGNAVIVTDIKKAIQQTEYFIEFSKKQTILFQEYFFTNSVDVHGKQIRLTSTPKKAKTATNLEFYEHQLKELLKINQNASIK